MLIHARVVGSRVDVVTLRDQMVRVAIFYSDGRELGREEEPVLLCSELMEKLCFSGSRISLISRCE